MHLTAGKSVDYPILTCWRCGQQFILIGAREERPEEDFDGWIMAQMGAGFCPYCGAREEGSVTRHVSTEVAALVALVQQAEWVQMQDEDRCPWCLGERPVHEDDCKMLTALAALGVGHHG